MDRSTGGLAEFVLIWLTRYLRPTLSFVTKENKARLINQRAMPLEGRINYVETAVGRNSVRRDSAGGVEKGGRS